MMPDRDDAVPEREARIRARAHALWEQEGQPHGRHDEHWAQACREIDGAESGSGTGDLNVGGPDGDGAGQDASDLESSGQDSSDQESSDQALSDRSREAAAGGTSSAGAAPPG